VIRKAVLDDLIDIMNIIKETIIEMHSYNNHQWDESYPQEKDFIKDIESGCLYVTERDGKLQGFVCVNKLEPAEYSGLNWSLNEEAMVIHRMSVNPDSRRMGIGTELMNFAEELALKNNVRYLKTDTYSINTKMNALFLKCGYKLVGEMSFLGKEKPFYSYEKILTDDKLNKQHYMTDNKKTYIKLSEEVNKARRVHTNFTFAIFICLFFGFGNPIFLVGTIVLGLYIFLDKNARQRMLVAMAVRSLQASKINKAKGYLERARNIANNRLVQALENDINKIENTGRNEIDNEAESGLAEDNIFNKQSERNLKGEELEKQGNIKGATMFYEQNIKEGFPGTHPYDRLRILYEKQKNYEEEIRVINRAIEVFDDLYLNCDIEIKKELYLETAQKYKRKLKKISK
jgi:GNAT superfamily N-acetyltransferase